MSIEARYNKVRDRIVDQVRVSLAQPEDGEVADWYAVESAEDAVWLYFEHDVELDDAARDEIVEAAGNDFAEEDAPAEARVWAVMDAIDSLFERVESGSLAQAA